MLAPRLFVATSPSTPKAAAVSRVVVVLPLVPETSAICRPAARLASRFGSTISPIRPPMTEPSPRPVARDSAAALRVRDVASLVRRGSLGSFIGADPTVRHAGGLQPPGHSTLLHGLGGRRSKSGG